MKMNYFNFSGFNSVEVLEYQIDDRDLHLISYIYTIQGSDNMEFINENGKVYYWLRNEKIIEDNPTLYAKTRTLNTMISNLCEKGLIEKIVRCQEKTTFKKTYYRITDKTRKMMFITNENNNVTLQCNTNVTSGNVTKEKNNIISNTRFSKPTIEEIKDYCLNERHNNVDWQKFYDYYESNGWKVGKNSMKDWKACVRTWERNTNPNQPKKEDWSDVTKAIRETKGDYKYSDMDENNFNF